MTPTLFIEVGRSWLQERCAEYDHEAHKCMLRAPHFKDHFYFANELHPTIALHASIPIVPQVIAEKLTTLPSLVDDACDTNLFITFGLDLIDTSLFEPDSVGETASNVHSWDHYLIVQIFKISGCII